MRNYPPPPVEASHENYRDCAIYVGKPLDDPLGNGWGCQVLIIRGENRASLPEHTGSESGAAASIEAMTRAKVAIDSNDLNWQRAS